MQFLCGCRIAIRKVSLWTLIWFQKRQSLYNNLKQKEGEGYKARELSANKEWFDNFRKRFSLENVKITGEAAFANQKTAGEFPDAIKKIIEGFPGGTVVKNLPANAGDMGSSPGPGRSHMPQSN